MITKQSSGFILITVMSLLLLTTLLTLGVMETSLLLRKQANSQWQFWQLATASSAANQHLVQSLLHENTLPCFASYQTNDRYWNQSATQWGEHSCQENQSTYQSNSIIERLPDTLCETDTENNWMFFNLYRITTQTKNRQGTFFRTQSSVIRAERNTRTCTRLVSGVSSGMESWRNDSLEGYWV